VSTPTIVEEYKAEDCNKFNEECEGDVIIWDNGYILKKPLCTKHATDAMQDDTQYFSKMHQAYLDDPDVEMTWVST